MFAGLAHDTGGDVDGEARDLCALELVQPLIGVWLGPLSSYLTR